MKYETVLSELLSTVPEIKTIVREKMIAEDVDEDDGMHIIFSFVIVPLLKEWCKKDSYIIGKIFDFFENMANSDNNNVLEILDFSVLEAIADIEESERKILENFMKPKTLDRYQYIRDHMFC